MGAPFLVGDLATPYAREGLPRWQASNGKFTPRAQQRLAFLLGILDARPTTPKYTGYVGQEFIPTRNPLEGLRQAVRLCNV
jgi:hypothetical protein